MDQIGGVRLHPTVSNAGPGAVGAKRLRTIDDVLAEARAWMLENPYSDVTISRRGTLVDLERSKKTRCEVGE